MQCPRCHAENPPEARFCSQCGSSLTLRCANCQVELEPGARFCMHCGYPVRTKTEEDEARLSRLASAIPVPLAEKMRLTPLSGERRVVTVLSVDVVGSTKLAEKLDIETWTAVMNGAFEHITPAIYRYEGTLARLLGDALVAFFGAPVAHEDDPLRAVYAALDVIDAARAYSVQVRQKYHIDFSLRASLARGPVVIGSVGNDLRYEFTALGGAVDTAVRLKFATQPMTVLVSSDVYRLVAPAFDCRDLGRIAMKGRSRLQHVYQVLGRKPQPGSLRGLAGLESPLVGRQKELDALLNTCEAVRAGLGRLVLVIGEPGVGKSRLIHEWRAAVERQQHDPEPQWVEVHCLSYGWGIPYHLLSELVRALLGLSSMATEAETSAALAALTQDLFADRQAEIYPYLAHLLSLKPDSSLWERPGSLDPEELQTRYLTALRSLVQGLAERRPLVLVLEDLHWADPSSIEVLVRLLSAVNTIPALLCLTTRLERDTPGWKLVTAARERLGSSLYELALESLSDSESRQLIANLLKFEALPEETRLLIMRKAEGNPLFVEEVIRMLIEQDVLVPQDGGWTMCRECASDEIPDNLQGLLMARIDRLPEDERYALSVASVVGRTFPLRVLEMVLGNGTQAAAHRNTLSALESAGLVSLAHVGVELEYQFCHNLVHQAAYASLLAADRRRLHLAVGNAMESLYPNRVEEHSSLLAHHFAEAGQDEQALRYYNLAARAALAAYANQEAESYYRRALQLSGAERQRATLLSSLGRALNRQSRFTEGIHVLREAIDLYIASGEKNEVARLYAEAARASSLNNDVPGSLRLAVEGLAEVAGAPESPEVAQLMHEAGRAYLFNGMPVQARVLCYQALQMAERLIALAVQADTLATIGVLPGEDPQVAIQHLEQSVRLAEQVGILRISHRAYHNLASLHHEHLGDLNAAYRYFLHAAEISRQRGAAVEEMRSLNRALVVLLDQGELRRAEETLSEFTELGRCSADPAECDFLAYAIQIDLAHLRGEWGEAIKGNRHFWEMMSQSGELQRLYGATTHLADNLLEMDYFGKLDDWSEAEAALEEATDLADRGIADRALPRSLLSILRSRQGRLVEARRLLEEAREQANLLLDKYTEKALYRAEFELAKSQRRWEEALAAVEKLAKLVGGMGARWELARAYLSWGDAYAGRSQSDDWVRAQGFYRQALDLFREMGATDYLKIAEQRLASAQSHATDQLLALERTAQEMLQAGKIQLGFLPEAAPQLPGWDCSAILQPARQTSGDFYDFIQLPHGKLGMVVADVSDKGAGAALYMTSGRTLLRTYAEEFPTHPEQVITAANRRLLLDTRAGLFITIFYAVLDPKTGQLTYCNAGHNPPILFRAPGKAEMESLTRTGMAMGVLEEASWEQGAIQIDPGDVLVLYTDGIVEAIDAQGDFFDEQRLVQAVQTSLSGELSEERSAAAIQGDLLRQVERFVGEASQSDDRTLMVLVRK